MSMYAGVLRWQRNGISACLRIAGMLFPISSGGSADAQQPLPALHDGVVLSGPGEFRHDGELFVQGKVTLKDLTLHLHGPIRIAAG